jgi:hypothetical protein
MPQLRDTQRFYARLGFGPVVTVVRCRSACCVGASRVRRMSLADNVVARRTRAGSGLRSRVTD